MPMECPRCGEIELVKINTTGDLDEWECGRCMLYTVTVNPDYDPTPEEQGEPPLTMEEKMGEPR